MSDRYGYNARPRSPTYNPARASLPINLSGGNDYHTTTSTLHVIPTSRQHIPTGHSRSSSSTSGSAGIITTTYKVTAEPPPRTSSVRSDSKRRSSTLENHNRPTVVTTVKQHKPVIHSARPSSPMKNPYRSSNEDYYAVPASSHHDTRSRHHRPADIDTSGNRLRVSSARHDPGYNGSSRPRSQYPVPVARHTDTSSNGDYPDDGFGYTNPRDLVQYDLNTTQSRPRRDSYDGGRPSRPSSIAGYTDLVPRSADFRERGPPPTTRGFDRIRHGATWDQPASARMPMLPPPSPMDPIQRPARIELPFQEQPVPVRRNGAQRPASMYHDRDREVGRRGSRDDVYEVRDPEPLRRRNSSSHRRPEPRYENPVAERGFGIRAEVPPPQPPRPDRVERIERIEREDRPERSERSDRYERSDRHDRSDRNDRLDRPERNDRSDRPERTERSDRGERSNEDREHRSSRDILTTGLGIAGAALGLKSFKNARDDSKEEREKEEREDREERRRREYDEEERRRHRDARDDREAAEKLKERRYRDEERERISPPLQTPREEQPSSRDIPPPIPPKIPHDHDQREMRERHMDQATVNLNGRDPRERDSREQTAPRHERSSSISGHDGEPDRRERRRRPDVPPSREDSRSDSASDPSHRESRPVKETVTTPTAAFNPKDTQDLKALKDALNSKDNAAAREVSPPVPKAARASFTKTSAEAADIRSEIREDRRSRETHTSMDVVQPRVVSPPRAAKVEEKPVKGILRQPREKFPEDPDPIREGVAPLKDAKKDGVPPDARWTKINRKLVNPEALELGKERYEARDDFVIVLRVLSRDEVQGYAEVTQKLRAAREDAERDERRRARRERHERHKRERNGGERSERRRRRDRENEKPQESESDTTESDEPEPDGPKMLEPAPPRRRLVGNKFEEAMVSGGLSGPPPIEDPNAPGQYLSYTRNPPPPSSVAASSGSSTRRDR
ncbi:hypothetical protein HYALB_00013344 [Hymenoscyphus albidus]|uniref:DUF8035 domain-containing protein n=1 Tax=Hymenoscyphus albidus TaxID=595503 RepID=A0A9N9LTS8_9HELO|nr:hypothetical protein HYALB_00013344 [Hymenoscyphus albidus]